MMRGADISTHQERIAVVTGANGGIGFEICRQLVKKRVRVVLTARDDVKGRKACEKLKVSFVLTENQS